jgi:hypothetical protein
MNKFIWDSNVHININAVVKATATAGYDAKLEILLVNGESLTLQHTYEKDLHCKVLGYFQDNTID